MGNGKNQVETLWERYNQFLADEKSKTASAEDSTSKEEGGDASGDAVEVDDGGTGPVIREALESHTQLIKLLIKSGADTTLKDKEGHAATDFDFHPDADSEILDKEAKAEKV